MNTDLNEKLKQCQRSSYASKKKKKKKKKMKDLFVFTV